MKKLIWLTITLLMLSVCALADEVLPVHPYTWTGNRLVRSYHTATLDYTVETTAIEGCKCYITKIWMQDPGQQIKKSTAIWEKDIQLPQDMAARIPGCALAINGSGYVSPIFPEIPDNYPGSSPDYYYTPLGSVTVTNGIVYRKLEGVPYYGLTLQKDGLHLHIGEDPNHVLAQDPLQTWSFYVECPLINDGVSILDREWPFAQRHAARTIIARIDANNYVLITATSSVGLTLLDAVDFLQANFHPEWAYDLDGGPSSALLCRNAGKKSLKVIYGGKSKDADMMGFVELAE